MSRTQRRDAIIGGGLSFTLLVVGLLVYYHTQEPEVPDLPGPDLVDEETDKFPPYWVCTEATEELEPAPEWVSEDMIAEVFNFWGELCYHVEDLGRGPCLDVCEYESEKETRRVPCKAGHISVSGADRWFASNHAGETLLKPLKGKLPHILVPKTVEGVDPTETIDLPPLPKDIKKRVFAHEVGHTFRKNHTFTELGNTGVGASKKGELMHPEVRVKVGDQWFPGIGWGVADLSRCETK